MKQCRVCGFITEDVEDISVHIVTEHPDEFEMALQTVLLMEVGGELL